MPAVASGLDTTRSHLVEIRDASMPRAYGLLLLLLPARTTSIERALVSLSIWVLSWLDSPHGRDGPPWPTLVVLNSIPVMVSIGCVSDLPPGMQATADSH